MNRFILCEQMPNQSQVICDHIDFLHIFRYRLTFFDDIRQNISKCEILSAGSIGIVSFSFVQAWDAVVVPFSKGCLAKEKDEKIAWRMSAS